MGDQGPWQSELYFARLLRARPLSPEERGFRPGRVYELPDGRRLSPRQMRKLAGGMLSQRRFPETDLRSRLFMAIRYRAWREQRSVMEIWEDPEFRARWQEVLRARRTRGSRRQVRIARAWELLDVTEPSIEGGWDYTEEFIAWLAAGAPES